MVGLVMAAAGLPAGTADAQRRQDDGGTRIGAHVLFGLGGEADVDVDAPWGLGGSGDDDLLTTFGFGVVAEHAVHRYFLLGGRFEAAWWNTDGWDDANFDRSVLLDFSPQAKGRYPFELGGARAEVSLTVPFGLTVSLPDNEVPGDPNTGTGFNVGILGGFAVTLDGGFGFYGEMGWRWHTFYHELDDSGVDVDVAMGQFVMHFGVMLGL